MNNKKRGGEAEFKKAWKEFAEWGSLNLEDAGNAYLLADIENPQKFISFGDWESLEAIVKWKGSEEFKDFMQKVEPFYENIENHTMKLVSTTEEELE